MNLEKYEDNKKELKSEEANVVFTLGHALEKGILLAQSYEDAYFT